MKKDMTRPLNLFQLTWPIFLETLLFTSIGLVDTFMLSAVSDDAVSGVGAANQYVQLAILLVGVISVGVSIVVAQYIGSQRFEEVAKVSATALTINLAFGLLLSVGFLVGTPFLLKILNLEGDVFHFANVYLVIVGSTLFLQAVMNVCSAVIRVHGFTKYAMYISVGMNVFNVIGNYVLIFGKFGFPVLGVEGAAIATVLSRVIGFALFGVLFYRLMDGRMKTSYYVQLSKRYVYQILQIGVPSAFEKVVYRGYQMTFLFYITFLGTVSLAARQYALNLTSFVYLFAIAIGSGTSIIVGRLIGAGNKTEADAQVRSSVKSAFKWTLLMSLILIAFRYPLLKLLTDDMAILELAATVLIWSLFVDTGGTINIVLVNALRATGDAKYPVVIGILSMVGIGLPLGYVLIFHLNLGLVGMWIALGVDEWLRAGLMYSRWKSRIWEKYILIK